MIVDQALCLLVDHHATAAQIEKLVRAYRCVLGSVESRAEREQAGIMGSGLTPFFCSR